MTQSPYTRSQIKSDELAKNAQGNSLYSALNHLLQETSALDARIQTQVGVVTHSYDPDRASLNKECSTFLKEFKKLAQFAFQLKPLLEQKIEELKDKGPAILPQPVPASSIQTIVMLHLVSEQSMGKRMEEISEVKRRQKDILNQLEGGYTTICARFDEIVSRLNLLTYMRDCLESDGLLPANIMYNVALPQVVSSPFAMPANLSSNPS